MNCFQTLLSTSTRTAPSYAEGNTASGGDKPATMSTGAVVTVPLFIQIGEMIVVDTREGKYLSRVNKTKAT